MRSKNLHFEGVVFKIQIYYLYSYTFPFSVGTKKKPGG
jgi:hypothetical protein